MLQRNLLYTGLTRASNSIILLGEPDAYQRAVSNESSNRNTSLERRINPQAEVLAEKVNQIQVSEPVDQEQSMSEPVEVEQPKYLTTSMVQKEQVDPMIGMEGVTPYDFI